MADDRPGRDAASADDGGNGPTRGKRDLPRIARKAWGITKTFGSRLVARASWIGVWKVIEAIAKGIETLGKPTALVLAIIGLVVVYVPHLHRKWEEWALPQAWYQVGTIQTASDGRRIYLNPGSYDSGAWNGGRLPVRVFDLVGTDVLTTDVAVGRSDHDTNAQVETILEANKCFNVRDVAFQRYGKTTKALFLPVYGLQDIPTGSNMEKLTHVLDYARKRDAPDCRKVEDAERSPTTGANAKAKIGFPNSGKASAGSSRPPPQLCVRTIVWIKAQKVTC